MKLFLISPSNPEELAEKIEILLNNDKLREKMGRAGNKWINKNFTIDLMTNKYIELYRNILKDRRSN
jgi:glycosyltransferase involved in cell wall biosynthesis